MRARSRLLTAFAFLGIASATACSAVLGFESLAPLPPEAGTLDASPVVGDATTDAVASPPDASDIPPEDSATPPSDGSTMDADAGPACVADLTSDPKHCGRCNHDCVGAKCTNSVCEPLKLADGLALPQGLTADGTYVYVAEYDQNWISRFGKSVASACQAPGTSQCKFIDTFRPSALSNDGARLYWVNDGTPEILSCPLAGCGAFAPTVIATLTADAFDHIFSPGIMPLDLVIRDGLVFWAESATGAIRSAQADGGSMRDGGTPTTYFQNASYMPLAIAVDQTDIYFTDETNQHPTQIAAVRRDGSNKDGGSVRVVASTPARPFGLALSKTNLYWTIPFVGGSGGLVQAAPTNLDGGAPTGLLATDVLDPYMIIADDTNVYWLAPGANNAATGMVLTCPLTGCPQSGPIVLAKDQRLPRHLAQDEKAIYWSNVGLITSTLYDGQVWKIAKP